MPHYKLKDGHPYEHNDTLMEINEPVKHPAYFNLTWLIGSLIMISGCIVTFITGLRDFGLGLVVFGFAIVLIIPILEMNKRESK